MDPPDRALGLDPRPVAVAPVGEPGDGPARYDEPVVALEPAPEFDELESEELDDDEVEEESLDPDESELDDVDEDSELLDDESELDDEPDAVDDDDLPLESLR